MFKSECRSLGDPSFGTLEPQGLCDSVAAQATWDTGPPPSQSRAGFSALSHTPLTPDKNLTGACLDFFGGKVCMAGDSIGLYKSRCSVN